MVKNRTDGLLAWQWSIYSDGHQDRRNLAMHVVTVPLFIAGTCVAVVAPFVNPWGLMAGIGAMAAAVALQGRTHAREQTPSAPFLGPRDVLTRIFLEQWVTFPRYVLSGAFGKAWRRAV